MRYQLGLGRIQGFDLVRELGKEERGLSSH